MEQLPVRNNVRVAADGGSEVRVAGQGQAKVAKARAACEGARQRGVWVQVYQTELLRSKGGNGQALTAKNQLYGLRSTDYELNGSERAHRGGAAHLDRAELETYAAVTQLQA